MLNMPTLDALLAENATLRLELIQARDTNKRLGDQLYNWILRFHEEKNG